MTADLSRPPLAKGRRLEPYVPPCPNGCGGTAHAMDVEGTVCLNGQGRIGGAWTTGERLAAAHPQSPDEAAGRPGGTHLSGWTRAQLRRHLAEAHGQDVQASLASLDYLDRWHHDQHGTGWPTGDVEHGEGCCMVGVPATAGAHPDCPGLVALRAHLPQVVVHQPRQNGRSVIQGDLAAMAHLVATRPEDWEPAARQVLVERHGLTADGRRFR